jgi:H+/gluconate symporter-like permease
MSVIIALAALALLMLAAYRGYSVILFAPSPPSAPSC